MSYTHRVIVTPEGAEPAGPFLGTFHTVSDGWEFREDPETTDDVPVIIHYGEVMFGQEAPDAP